MLPCPTDSTGQEKLFGGRRPKVMQRGGRAADPKPSSVFGLRCSHWFTCLLLLPSHGLFLLSLVRSPFQFRSCTFPPLLLSSFCMWEFSLLDFSLPSPLGLKSQGRQAGNDIVFLPTPPHIVSLLVPLALLLVA